MRFLTVLLARIILLAARRCMLSAAALNSLGGRLLQQAVPEDFAAAQAARQKTAAAPPAEAPPAACAQPAEAPRTWHPLPGGVIELGNTGFQIRMVLRTDRCEEFQLRNPEGCLVSYGPMLMQLKHVAESLAAWRLEFAEPQRLDLRDIRSGDAA